MPLVFAGALLADSSAWGYSTYLELDSTRRALAATEFNLASTRDDLDQTRAALSTASDQLDGTKRDLSKEQAARAASDRTVATLQTQVAAQVSCVQALNADQQEIDRIQSLVIDNYNRRAKGSTWATASLARDTATSNAMDDYFQAYSSAFDGLRSLANSYAAQGITEQTKASTQLAIMNREIAAMNAANSQIDTAFAALAARQQSTNATCRF